MYELLNKLDNDEIMALALRINDFLVGLFCGIGIRLVDFKAEFGRLWENEQMRVVLADEISPDCCRLWDIQSGDKLDKDRFRRDMGGVLEAYQEVARRLGIPLIVLTSPYRSILGPLLEYIDLLIEKGGENHVVTIVVPEFIPARWWQQLLHNQTALLIKGAMLFRKNVVVTDVPYHLRR